MCCEEGATRFLFTFPMGRGRRAAPGEGIRSIDTPKPLTRIASDDAIRPLPAGEVTNRPFHPPGSAKGRYQTRNDVDGQESAFSRRDAPEVCVNFRATRIGGRGECRMRAAPAVSC